MMPRPAEETLSETLSRLWRDAIGTPDRVEDEDFFSRGGSSLDAARLVSAIRGQLGIRVGLAEFFSAPTMNGLRGMVERARDEPHQALPSAGADPDVGLSPAQRRLWLMHLLDPGSPEFTVVSGVRLRGELAAQRLAMSWQRLVTEHAELRLRVVHGEGGPGRAYWVAADFVLERQTATEDELPELLRLSAKRGFDIFGEPLARLEFFRLTDYANEHLLLLSAHHIVVDRKSVGLIMARLLADLGGSSPPPLEPVRSSVQAIRESMLTGEQAERERQYWAAELATVAQRPKIDLNTRLTPAVEQRRHAGTVTASIPAVDWARVRELARSQRTTPLVLFLAAFALVADRYGTAGEVVGGTTMDVRPPGYDEVVGLFVNPVPLRLACRPGTSAATLIADVHHCWLSAHEHRWLPFDDLVKVLNLRTEPGRSPLFQALIDFEPAGLPFAPQGLAVEPVELTGDVAKYDLELVLQETYEAGALVNLGYRLAVCDRERAEQLVSAIRDTLVLFAAEPGSEARVPVDSQGSVFRRELATSVPPEHVGTLVERASLAHAEHTAAVSGADRIGYGVLRERARAVVEDLAESGLMTGDAVAVLAPRGTDMIVAILAAAWAGTIMVPLNANYPDARLADALKQSGARLLMCTPETTELAGSLGIPCLDVTGSSPRRADITFPRCDGGDGAYIIFTSGSTGQPKGVLVEHGSLAVSTAARREVYPGTAVFLLLSPIAFDSSIAGIWGTLTSGGTLVVATEDEVRDPALLLALIEREAITDLLCVPSLYDVLLAEAGRHGVGGLGSLHRVLVAGEPLPERVMDEHFALLPRVELVNEYGPTEATVWSTYRRYRTPNAVSIGGPVPGYSLYVLDHALRPVPPGVTGELYVGGPGVARGYVGRAADTAGAFLPDPYAGQPSARMYRTGDRVRRNDQGGLSFLGRVDDQVKIRGHRIQPAEIEAVLREVPGVRDAVVVADGSGQLTAFVIGSAGEDLIRRASADRLPTVMVPRAVYLVESFPATANGKVDRKRLASDTGPLMARIERESRTHHATAEAPGVVAAWREVLGHGRIPAEANFFDLGGHSLLVPKLQDALHRTTGVRIPILDLFRHTTVASQAALLDAAVPPSVTPAPDGTAVAVPAARSRRAPSANLRAERLRSRASGVGAFPVPTENAPDGREEGD